MRTDIRGLCRNAAAALALDYASRQLTARERESHQPSMYAFSLRELAENVALVNEGKASLEEFCDHYCITARPKADWLPTAENINALPDPVRRYIHDLESDCDPSGTIRENVMAKDLTRQLEAKILELESEVATLKDQNAKLESSLRGAWERVRP